MSEGDLYLAWQQRQMYLANQKFEEPVTYKEPIEPQDAYISEDERWEELCHQQKSQPQSS